ncbi:hypothetical protein E0H22_25180 [Rhodopseudomonas boonkerdii]|nr:hypothetical protein E0H22_25180 [Rhodopseudomonas boonkerdii]
MHGKIVGTGAEKRSSLEVFLVFLKLGLTSFGGPVAHLGYFRSEIAECSSSDNLRPLRHFEKGGSGSSRVKV